MKTVAIRDFRTRPRQVRETLAGEREALLTSNGRPLALLLPVDAATVDQVLETLRHARALEAVRAIRRERAGARQLSMKDVDALVARTRRARRSRRGR